MIDQTFPYLQGGWNLAWKTDMKTSSFNNNRDLSKAQGSLMLGCLILPRPEAKTEGPDLRYDFDLTCNANTLISFFRVCSVNFSHFPY